MDDETRRRLRALNRRFYQALAPQFSASRNHPWPGWTQLLASIEECLPRKEEPLRVLDVGCGNARFARFLCEHAKRDFSYLGIDESAALLALAREQCESLERGRIAFERLDVLEPEPGARLPAGPFDLVVAFGLFHHVPGRSARSDLLGSMLERSERGAIVALSAWRFAGDPRFAKGVVAWQRYNERAEQPIDLSQLERGDHLLRFGDDTGPDAPLRYCHHADDDEIASWGADAAAETLASFLADGRSGDLNRHLVLRRS